MVIDILFLVFLISGFAMGFKRGLIHSIFGLIGLFFGILFALKFSHHFSVWIIENTGYNSQFLPFLSFIGLLFLVLALVRVVSLVIESLAKALFMNTINRVIGGLLWCIALTFLFSTLLWYLNEIDVVSQHLKDNSQSYPFLISAAPIALSFFAELIPYFEGLFDQIKILFDQSSSSGGSGTIV